MSSSPADEQRLRDLALLRRVRDRMDREYAKPLDVEALARGVNMSSGHLSREFKRAYGESPYSYLMTRRIERAMALLQRGDLSVTEVCFEVGCSSLGTCACQRGCAGNTTHGRPAAASMALLPQSTVNRRESGRLITVVCTSTAGWKPTMPSPALRASQ